MQELFPEINKKIKRLEEIKNDPEKWKEAEEVNAYLLEVDGFRKYSLQLEILKYF
jgi:hypothetical protein